MVGVCLVIILMTLLLLYNCERYSRHNKMVHKLDDLGQPHEENNWYTTELVNETRLAELSDFKPDEILTLDRNTLLSSKQYLQEDTVSVYSHNSAHTIGRKSQADYNKKKNASGYTNSAFRFSSEIDRPPAAAIIPAITVTPSVVNFESGKKTRGIVKFVVTKNNYSETSFWHIAVHLLPYSKILLIINQLLTNGISTLKL